VVLQNLLDLKKVLMLLTDKLVQDTCSLDHLELLLLLMIFLTLIISLTGG
jgi:hypothetical protein